MFEAIILTCAIALPEGQCTIATAERFEIVRERVGLAACLLGSEESVAALADPGLAKSYLKVVCRG